MFILWHLFVHHSKFTHHYIALIPTGGENHSRKGMQLSKYNFAVQICSEYAFPFLIFRSSNHCNSTLFVSGGYYIALIRTRGESDSRKGMQLSKYNFAVEICSQYAFPFLIFRSSNHGNSTIFISGG